MYVEEIEFTPKTSILFYGFYLSVLSFFCHRSIEKMVSRQVLVTRSASKRRLIENAKNAPMKKIRLAKMKQMANAYIKNKKLIVNKVNFKLFYDQNKIIYPWLSKESLRWHIRNQEKLNKVTTISNNIITTSPSDTSTTEGSNVTVDSIHDSSTQVSHEY